MMSRRRPTPLRHPSEMTTEEVRNLCKSRQFRNLGLSRRQCLDIGLDCGCNPGPKHRRPFGFF